MTPAGSGQRTSGVPLAHHVVVVTGAGRGLGRAIALAAVAAGATVVAMARSNDELARTARLAGDDADRLVTVVGDVTDQGSVTSCLDAVSVVDCSAVDVVHGAGVQSRAPALSVEMSDWRRVLDVNLTAPFFLSSALARRSVAAGVGGSHVFIGSLASQLGLADIAPYAASKAGLLGVMRTVAVEWAPQGIRANALCPGYFATDMTSAVLDDQQRQAWVLSRIPMARLGEPSEVAEVATFLLSDAASYVTGQAINVDGGWTGA